MHFHKEVARLYGPLSPLAVVRRAPPPPHTIQVTPRGSIDRMHIQSTPNHLTHVPRKSDVIFPVFANLHRSAHNPTATKIIRLFLINVSQLSRPRRDSRHIPGSPRLFGPTLRTNGTPTHTHDDKKSTGFPRQQSGLSVSPHTRDVVQRLPP